MINRIFLFVLVIIGSVALPPQNPIIGIYTQDTDLEHPETFKTYIAASYIKNIQMSGAQAIPLFYHYSKAQLEDILSKINGVFLPGGQMPIDKDNQWTSNVGFIVDYAIKQNDLGNPYPIWATCLSYQAIMYLYSGRKDNMTILTKVYGQRGLPGYLIPKTQNSTLLKSLNSQQYKQSTTKPGILWFHHTWAITLKDYQQSEGINKFWKLVSTSLTEDNVQFVSTVQAYNYPFFMTQYHPQKNSFQWLINATRTYNSVSVQQKFINQFTKIARMNTNRFTSEEEWVAKSIFNYNPTYTPNDPDFVLQYIFDQSKL